MKRASRFFFSLLLPLTLLASCAKSPEDVRAWIRDKRAPVKMREFIQSSRNPLDAKVEALMVLVERNNAPDIPTALGDPLKSNELNEIVAATIPRMQALYDDKDAYYQTRIKDAAYYLLKLELNDQNRAALTQIIRTWLDSDNFFLPIAKAGRVEQQKLFELLGTESLDIYKKAIEKKLHQLEEALRDEAAQEAKFKAEGKKYRITLRPSDLLTQTLAQTLSSLDALKIPGANEMVVDIFLPRMQAAYPNMIRAYALPFSSNPSPRLVPMATKIVNDPDYKNIDLNYFKDVMLVTYFRNVQKSAGSSVCTTLIQTDRTGYTRWDCLEIVTATRDRAAFASVLQSIPNDPALLLPPADHPALLSRPDLTFWTSVRLYCAHLPAIFNNHVPLEVFRQLLQGTTIDRILSMACLMTLGTSSDVELLESFHKDSTDIQAYGMQVKTLGQLAHYASVLLDKRLAAAKGKGKD